MTNSEFNWVSFIIQVIVYATAIAIIRHQRKVLIKRNKEIEILEKDKEQLKVNYNSALANKHNQILTLENTIRFKDNTIKSWEDAEANKQQALDNIKNKYYISLELLVYLSKNWNKLLVIKENDQYSFPALRLSNNEKFEYDVKSYQGSRDLNDKTEFRLPLARETYTNLNSIIIELSASLNPKHSELLKDVTNFLNIKK